MSKSNLIAELQILSKQYGFSSLSIARLPNLKQASLNHQNWCANNLHGEMSYLNNNATLRADPKQLFPQLKSIILLSLNYWQEAPADFTKELNYLNSSEQAYISRYALGGDYHQYFRHKMRKFAQEMQDICGEFTYRVCSDSAPIMEVEIAAQSGLGWRGKNTLLLNRQGSLFFLGEILTSLDLPSSPAQQEHCGKCSKCIDICPTQAIVAPYQIDARRCISYLTIEHQGSIPLEFRSAIGNRIYGCDDCQLVCPWNKFSEIGDTHFATRNQLDNIQLLELLMWSSDDFNLRLRGSPIRRIGHIRWLRNLAVAIGNAANSYQQSNDWQNVLKKLSYWQNHPSEIVREHINWAIDQQKT